MKCSSQNKTNTHIQYKPFNMAEYKACFVVTDSTLSRLYNIVGDNVFILPCGESAKSFQYVQAICQWLLDNNVSRQDTLVAVGGGSVGDVVGFVSSIFKRGINFVNVPTTLLAMVDSAIGGKTAIDFNGVKNVIGSFVSANTVIDFNFLNTLDKEQFDSGVGEIKKYAMLSKGIFDLYVNQGVTNELIIACINYKQNIVSQDTFDKGIRQILNLGHTIAHALELKFDLLHGKAVEYGLSVELNIAVKLDLVESKFADNLRAKLHLPQNKFALTQCIDYMLNDKKNINNKVTFCLPYNQYQTKIVSLDKDTLLELLQDVES